MICIYTENIERRLVLLLRVGTVVRNSLLQFTFNPFTQLLRFDDSDTFTKAKYLTPELIV